MATRLSRTAQRAALLELGGVVAEELKKGLTGDGTRTVGDLLAGMPQAVLDVMGLIEKEARKKRPDDHLVAALAFMAGQALELLRYGVERAEPAALDMLATVRERLVALARSDRADPTVLMLLAKQFAAAKLDIGEALRQAMGDVIADEAELSGASLGSDMDRDLAALGQDLGDDAFSIHLELAETTASLPIEHRLALAKAVLASASSAVCDAALGWLLDPQPELRVAVAEALNDAAKAGRLSSASLRRLVAMRNWVPPTERGLLDSAIATARRQGGEPNGAVPIKVVELLASGFDGSGAGSVFALVRTGRLHAVASLLFKTGMGVRDAWVQRDLTKAQAGDLLDELASQIELVSVSIDVLRRSLPHFLSVNAATGLLPPFGTLDVIETTGLGIVNPQQTTAESIVEELLPDEPGPELVETALAASAAWLGAYAVMDSWFEDGAPVEQALKGKGSLSRSRKAALILEKVIGPQRRRWGEVLAWTALIAVDGADKDTVTSFAIVARETMGERPVAEIPLLLGIAEATVEAWRQRRA